jgi:hypothetical protein
MNAISKMPLDETTMTLVRERRLAAVADLSCPAVEDGRGRVGVPLKPSALMLAAGARAGEVSVEVAWKIYQAMLREVY